MENLGPRSNLKATCANSNMPSNYPQFRQSFSDVDMAKWMRCRLLSIRSFQRVMSDFDKHLVLPSHQSNTNNRPTFAFRWSSRGSLCLQPYPVQRASADAYAPPPAHRSPRLALHADPHNPHASTSHSDVCEEMGSNTLPSVQSSRGAA